MNRFVLLSALACIAVSSPAIADDGLAVPVGCATARVDGGFKTYMTFMAIGYAQVKAVSTKGGNHG